MKDQQTNLRALRLHKFSGALLFVWIPCLVESPATAAALDVLREKANQAPAKDSAPPSIIITTPSNNISLNTWRVDVRGDFKATALKQITVNKVPAFVGSNTFEAFNVLLEPGTNIIVAIGEDAAGNTATNLIRVIGTAAATAFTNDPLRLIANPPGGFAPLKVSFDVKASVPGNVRQVLYDFDGDHVTDWTNRDLQPVTHSYATPGERYPVVTVETAAGRFSSIGSGFGFFPGLRVTVQATPVLVRSLNVPDPVDLKSVKTGELYVLSGSTATITEFDSDGKAVRSLKGVGAMPSGLDVDEGGNVYVAVAGSNQVWKLKPTRDSFEKDASFGNGGVIGGMDGTGGSNSNQFNAPFDVAISPDGLEIFVSDSGNNRIQRFSNTGLFRSSFDGREFGVRPLKDPRGLVCDGIGRVFIVDSGNDRIVVAQAETYSFFPRGVSGETGQSLGQFRAAANLCTGNRGVGVADAGNNRVQFFDPDRGGHTQLTPFTPRFALSSELGLKQPRAAAWMADLLEEKVCIADTGNNRVLLVKLPSETPEAIWNALKQRILAGNINGALAYFSNASVDQYRQAYASIGAKELSEMFSKIPAIKPVFIENDNAQYRFEQMVQGQLITFPIQFVKENGKWKIEGY